MTLTDLMNHHYTRGVREAMLDLILGRSDNIVKGHRKCHFWVIKIESPPQCSRRNGLPKRRRKEAEL